MKKLKNIMEITYVIMLNVRRMWVLLPHPKRVAHLHIRLKLYIYRYWNN